MNLAGNKVWVRGDYAKSRVQANWVIHAPALDRLARLGTRYLGVELAGQLDSEGSVSGSPTQPQIKMHAQAHGLRLPGGIAADSLKLQLDMQASARGAFNGELLGSGLALGGQTVSSARVVVRGQRSAHAIELDARLPEWQRHAARARRAGRCARVAGRLLQAYARW